MLTSTLSGALPYKIDVKGWPLGAHTIRVSATDVFGSTAEATFEYLGEDFVRRRVFWEELLYIRFIMGISPFHTLALGYLESAVYRFNSCFYGMIINRHKESRLYLLCLLQSSPTYYLPHI